MHRTRTPFDRKRAAFWVATFIGFPLAGLAARGVAGNIDGLGAAALGGLAAGLVLGAIQALARGGDRREALTWIGATGVGLGVGLAAGAALAGYETGTGDLVLMGAVSGAGVGIAQAVVLRAPAGYRFLWAAATPALWALGWFVTAQVIVDADRHHATFGASGAIVVSLLGALLVGFRPVAAEDAPAPQPAVS